MNMTLSFAPLVSLLAGILILVVPRLLNYIVAIYLIIIGLLGLSGTWTWSEASRTRVQGGFTDIRPAPA